MAIIKRKTVFVPFEVWHVFSTSRRWQWLAIALAAALIVVAIISGLVISRYHAERDAREKELRQAAERARLERSLYHLPAAADKETVLGIDTHALPPSVRESLSDGITKELSSGFPSATFASDALLPGFYSGGYFDRAFEGDTAFFGDTGFFEGARTLLLVKPEVSFKDSSLGSGMRSCALDLAFRAYSSAQAPARLASIHSTGSGFSDEASLRDALEKLFQGQRSEVSAVMKGPR